MERNVDKAIREAEKITIPEECAENDRAVLFLAKETGVGHYDNVNLLVMAALLIFVSVVFLAINGGDINDDNKVNLTKTTFLSGEFTAQLEKQYNRQLPIPELMKTAEEHVALLYGIGNKLSDPVRKTVAEEAEQGRNLFEELPEDNTDQPDIDENVLTTSVVQTDKNGNTVTTSEKSGENHGKGTTAIDRPYETYTTTVTTTLVSSVTTTNNDPPDVTTTTTVPYEEPETTTTTTTEATTTEPEVTTTEEPTETTTEAPTETTTEEPTETTTEEPEEPEEPPVEDE